ncbi:MAG: phosphopantothenoylcysteine decarboxylase/phosphopantothenate--cysteine ligase [Oleiphilaceae bacterium]|jgi:phosphopantothenoylcysteine decarboxylase/phosphopantothenate--cysteine ligase
MVWLLIFVNFQGTPVIMNECFSGKKILLGLTGGIAAYKSADLCRQLTKLGAQVRVVMTQGACEFITPLTMQALSGNEVHTNLLNTDAEAGMGHIELAKWPDLIVVAPATANFIAKYASGLADDLLTTVLIASTARVVIAPAMNQDMWLNPITQHNLDFLQKILRGNLNVVGPDVGVQACGDVGPGRLLEPLEIVEYLAKILSLSAESLLQKNKVDKLLAGKVVVITAGPTREAIDPVRYISNHSSGKMGYALALACNDLGAKVIVISGPCNLLKPENVDVIYVQSALEMFDKVQEIIDRSCDIFIACAAVADYRPIHISDQKIKKDKQDSNELVIRLEENPDIVASVTGRKNKPFTVGFAAETQNIREYAKDKLKRKNLDIIIANDVSKPGQGFNSEFNQVTIISAEDEIQLDLDEKEILAEKIAAYIASRYFPL